MIAENEVVNGVQQHSSRYTNPYQDFFTIKVNECLVFKVDKTKLTN